MAIGAFWPWNLSTVPMRAPGSLCCNSKACALSGVMMRMSANTARDNHNPTSPYADLGTLIEPAATNSTRNNMVVGAVAADGIERTINGAFNGSGGACSGASCYVGRHQSVEDRGT